MAETLAPNDVGGISVTKLFSSDSTAALGQQLSSIFSNLNSTPNDRQQRAEECLSALTDTLFLHENELGANESLHERIIALIDGTFCTSVDKGCSSFRVVFDVKWKDQHEKRNRCFVLLLSRAFKCTTPEDCLKVIQCLGEVLEDNIRTTTDLLADNVEPLLRDLFAADVHRRTVACEVLAKIVSTTTFIIKRNPTLLELLTSSCAPLVTLKDAMETRNLWHRTALIRLTSALVENCYEVTPAVAKDVADLVFRYMRAAEDESQLVGVLSALIHVAVTPAFVSAPWDLPQLVRFLCETDWSVYAVATRVAAVAAINKVAFFFCQEEKACYEALRTRSLEFISLDDAVEVVTEGLELIKEMEVLERELHLGTAVVNALCACIQRLPHVPIIYELLELIRERYGDLEVKPIYSLLEGYLDTKQELLNFGKVNALLRFAGPRIRLDDPRLAQLRINVGANQPIPVILHSLPLLTTLQRTEQLHEVLEILSHDDRGVRRVAVSTALELCEIMMERNKFRNATPKGGVQRMQWLDEEVSNAVERVLDVAVADRDPEIRLWALQHLTVPFFPYLCLCDNLDAIFMARNDNDKATRDQALTLLCQLLPYHPTVVQPQLQRAQEYMLHDVATMDASVSFAVCKAGLLKMCVDHEALLIEKSTVEAIVLRRLEAQPFISRSLSIALLQLIRSILERTASQHHSDFHSFLRPLLLIVNGGDSCTRRREALETLTAFISHITKTDISGLSEVYRAVARIIRRETEEEESVTIAAMKVLSSIGAVTPVKMRHVFRMVESDEMEEEEEVVTPALAHCKPRLRISTDMPERYPSTVLYYLVRSLQLALDPKQQVDTLVAVRTMLHDVEGKVKLNLLTQLLPQLQTWLRDPERAFLYETVLGLMNDLAILLCQFKESVAPSVGHELLRSVQAFCLLPQASQKPFSAYVVQLLDSLAKGIPAQEMRDNRWAIEFIHQRLSQNKNDLDLVHRVVKSLESFIAVMHEKELQMILPHVLQCIEPAKASPGGKLSKSKDINDACFDFLNFVMAKQLTLVKHCCAQIVHTIMWYIELADSNEEMDVGLNTLATLVDTVKMPAKRFIMPIERVAVRNGFPPQYFVNLVQSAAGGAKIRMTTSNGTGLNPDRPITLVSHLPRLSQAEFEHEMRSTPRSENVLIDVLDVRHHQGQTMIDFRFHPGTDTAACCNLFSRKATDNKSAMRRNLGILRVEQTEESPRPVGADVIKALANLPVAKTKKREQSWVLWLHNATVTLLRNSPYAVLRDTCAVADRNTELAKDLFPFAVAAVCGHLETPLRAQLMDIFDRALAAAPADVKQGLFCFAEFMESERDDDRVKLVKVMRESVFSVDRESTSQKFGINYDQDPERGVIVTKLAPNGLGARAGVPIGAQLLAINDIPVRAVSDIRGLIEGLTHIELLLSYEVEEKTKSKPKPLMNLEVLASVAFSGEMHIKAIYFNEVLFESLSSKICKITDRKDSQMRRVMTIAEDLIQYYRHLNMTMTANGLLKTLTRKFSDEIFAPEQFGFEEIASLEQLNWWSEALRRYEARMASFGARYLEVASLVGVLRCEQALGHSSRVQELAEQYWEQLPVDAQREVAPFRAKAAFCLGAWDTFDALALDKRMQSCFGVVERCAALFRAECHDELLRYTDKVRESMLESFADSLNENYNRAYEGMTRLQHLRHFEELVSFTTACEERQALLKRVWHRRLVQMSSRPDDLMTVLSINSLVLEPEDDLHSYVYVIRCLCKSQWFSHAEHLLQRLLRENASLEVLCECDPELIHTYIKYVYLAKDKHGAYVELKNILSAVEVDPEDPRAEMWGQCWLLLGEWTMYLFPDCGEEAIKELMCATELGPNSAAAFHSLGILHCDLARDPSTQGEVQNNHLICCINSLFKSIQLCNDVPGSLVMQDVLRILSVWFANSSIREINEAVHHGVQVVADHVWLNVVPQLIARIGIEARYARAILTDLLIRVGSQYSHALIYPLTVAEKSPDAVRRHMAERVIMGMRNIPENDRIVKEASLVSNEMVRIAILWTEKWHAAIQQAAYKPNNTAAIFSMLQPLYAELDRASTPNELSFRCNFGQTLRRAKVALEEAKTEEAWGFLRQVYAQLRRGVLERRLYMSDVSPTLDGIQDSIVAVPGTFEHDKPLITILKFHSRVYVMPSKQKPRRIGLDASDGKKYRFLLKGHEDMRQDERVMQFIRLIDTIFQSDNAASAIGLSIPQYAVIPLTDNVGVVGWVENTETIYKMLETYRQAHEVSIYEEVNLIMKKGGLDTIEDYHRLPKQQRKALLNYAMENTPKNELRHIFWDHNDTCEQWLSYRQTYGQTLAAMSMVGYVLGLGDRHLNNLMLQGNGTVVHIDFGDCFEVAMHRALYAEAVPFRLTRLLVCALGITGVDGLYRMTCELAMKNLHRHSENLLSILEAFIYDPIINWRLNTVNDVTEKSGSKSAQQESSNGGTAALAGETAAAACLGVDDAAQAEAKPVAMQLSKSVSKLVPHSALPGESQMFENGEETRNQQGDLALARVQAKLTGQDFGVVNSSFSMMRSSRRLEAGGSQPQGSSWGSNSLAGFTDSPKDSFAAPLLTTYLSLRVLNGGAESLDVPHQVDRLIQEATSLDNLSDAFLTGWAPFW
ncbi:phosphatidylinositol 3-kinase-like protei [Leishmania infantum JPCM5]|uniref:non-specific serine/threonine protein kinase n=2 Tax=Leishmania infantum TaxID=5671 RepID=A0A6L0XPE7_LEIIN|nr:phosphatidylinositol 3-kinase-like protei [Leishmania infantum JPCM5]CAC9541356.1 target_of_rapamycin_kinase_3 [Leishmania infantum]CAM71820.1 phosphatidylinositol 3-kinase-like protei [Leishmania infantum JPCM5]SUZ45775.1 target_of_rapamycin_kinase_3 [Leishmania infantum]|eukprot:XP_001468732.1 phosphatidylinositol 3-kinase-like protei [Leishmania infantum JPCM5]